MVAMGSVNDDDHHTRKFLLAKINAVHRGTDQLTGTWHYPAITTDLRTSRWLPLTMANGRPHTDKIDFESIWLVFDISKEQQLPAEVIAFLDGQQLL